MSDLGRRLMKDVLRKFDGCRVINSTVNNIFAEKEKADLIKFTNHNIIIPWYLKPFSKVITSIAYSSFKDGLSENCTDTVTFRRPKPYKEKGNEYDG